MKLKTALILLLLSVLSTYALAQENSAEYWLNEGHELFANGSYEEAVKAYDRAIELEPNNATLYIAKVPSLNMLAIITNNQSKRNESLEAIDKALQMDPKDPRAWELKGSVLSQMKRYNESMEAYDKAIENIESYQGNQTEMLSGLWLSKAYGLQLAGEIEESFAAFNKSVQINPGYYDGWMMMGRALMRLGKYNESIQAYDKAENLPIASSRPSAKASPWLAKADALMAMGRYEEAEELYNRTIELNSTDESVRFYVTNAWIGKGNALTKLGRQNESLRAFDKAIELDPSQANQALTDKGNALLDAGRYEEALQAYDKAIQEAPEFASHKALVGKGRVLDEMGKHGEAVKAYEEALKDYDHFLTMYPTDGEIWYNKGTTLKALGRTSEADEANARAKELGYVG